jgi:DNA-binding PadR family transcriptional regulator
MPVTDKPSNLSPAESLILTLLRKSRREMYGLELVRASDGAIARGSVYVLLNRLESKALVTSRQEALRVGVPGIPRRLYRATKRAH